MQICDQEGALSETLLVLRFLLRGGGWRWLRFPWLCGKSGGDLVELGSNRLGEFGDILFLHGSDGYDSPNDGQLFCSEGRDSSQAFRVTAVTMRPSFTCCCSGTA